MTNSQTRDLCWEHLLAFNADVLLDSDHFQYGYSSDDGVVSADIDSDEYHFYISSKPYQRAAYEVESFYDGAIYYSFRKSAPTELVEFLREYWVLATYMKIVGRDKVFVMVHMAQSLDGKVCADNGNSKWIGNQENLIHAHRLRALVDGVMVGGKTASADLPSLTVRHVSGSHPKRLIFSNNFQQYDKLKYTEGQETINIRNCTQPKDCTVNSICYDGEDADYLDKILSQLRDQGVNSILIEGGPKLASTFLSQGQVDVVQLHLAPMIIGSGKSSFTLNQITVIDEATTLTQTYYSDIGDAQMITGVPQCQIDNIQPINTLQSRSNADIPTKHGTFNTVAYSDTPNEKMPHLALINPSTDFSKVVNVRIHSECMTGDVFGSYRCECGEQLDKSMEYISQNGGVIVYLRQEGRGIGIINKLHAYVKQDNGFDTAEANKVLGFGYDERTYTDAIAILNDLGIKRINLLTNNTDKVKAFNNSNIEIVERLPLEMKPKKENEAYLKTKKEFFGHQLEQV